MARTRLQSPFQDEVVLSLDHAELTDDATVKFFKVPAGKTLRVTKVEYINPTGLAEHADNHFALSLKQASVVVAGPLSTDADGAGDNGLVADTFTEIPLSATPADLIIEAGEILSFFADEGGTATLPAGRLVVHGRYI